MLRDALRSFPHPLVLLYCGEGEGETVGFGRGEVEQVVMDREL